MPAEDNSKSPRPFDVRTIKALLALMGQNDLSELDLREGPRRIRLRRGGAIAAAPAPIAHAPAPASAPVAAPAASPAAAEKPAATIKSPTPGTFYSKPDPDSPAFVSVGSRVTKDTVVCIIEAMKIFNEIHADCSGVITKVLLENAQPVEYGQVLFEVDPAG